MPSANAAIATPAHPAGADAPGLARLAAVPPAATGLISAPGAGSTSSLQGRAPSAQSLALARQLNEACAEGKVKEVIALIAAGADLNHGVEEPAEDGKTRTVCALQAALRYATREDATPKMARKQVGRMMKVLVDRGAEVAGIERDLLVTVVAHDLSEALEVLLKQDLRLKRYAYELVATAIVNQSYSVFPLLAAAGVSPNTRDAHGSTPLLDYCAGSLPLMAKRRVGKHDSAEELAAFLKGLAEYGVDLHAVDRVGATALMRCIASGREMMARALVLAGAATTTKLRNGVSIMHLAASCMGQDFLRFLFSHGGPQEELKRLQARRLQPDVRAMVLSIQKNGTAL